MVKALEYFGANQQLVVIDNLKNSVTHAYYDDLKINPTFVDLAHHYSVEVLSARVRKPKDKAKGESGVLQMQQCILVGSGIYSFSVFSNSMQPLPWRSKSSTFDQCINMAKAVRSFWT
jgi:hypothetical protein